MKSIFPDTTRRVEIDTNDEVNARIKEMTL